MDVVNCFQIWNLRSLIQLNLEKQAKTGCCELLSNLEFTFFDTTTCYDCVGNAQL